MTRSEIAAATLGRFAPSPTGPLHAGSLIAALAARSAALGAGGRCLLRIDDIDEPRNVAGAETAIIETLARFGLFERAETLCRQSQRLDRYHAALRRLGAAGLLYRCACSRREQTAGQRCRRGCRRRRLSTEELEQRLHRDADGACAIRVRLEGALRFVDAVQGTRDIDLERDVGDIVVHRRDGLVAWPLATACDDAAPVTDVVRGADLLEPTPAQIALIERIDERPPRYAHVPVLLDEDGAKLGKRSGAPAIALGEPLLLLRAAWRFLGQHPLVADDVTGFHRAAVDRFELARVPRLPSARSTALSAFAARLP